MHVLFDLEKWESIKCGSQISYNMMPKEFKLEKDLINDNMFRYIFEKYKHNTAAHTFQKTTTGYTFSRKCQKYQTKGCKNEWYLRINVYDKYARLERQHMCSHTTNSM